MDVTLTVRLAVDFTTTRPVDVLNFDSVQHLKSAAETAVENALRRAEDEGFSHFAEDYTSISVLSVEPQ